MEHTSKPLPGAGTIISDSWKLFTSTWKTSIKTSSLMIYLGLAYFVGGLLTKVNENLVVVEGLIGLGGAIFSVWISTRILLTMLNLEAGKQPMAPEEESKKAWALFASILWVGFLTGLVVFGASLLLILPGIYFGIALTFSQTITVDQGIKGTKALGASRDLVRGRWWATFWRLLSGGFVFGVLTAVIIGVIMIAAGAIAGDQFLAGDEIDPLVNGVLQLLQMVVMAGLMPLFSGFQIKVYRLLQKTR